MLNHNVLSAQEISRLENASLERKLGFCEVGILTLIRIVMLSFHGTYFFPKRVEIQEVAFPVEVCFVEECFVMEFWSQGHSFEETLDLSVSRMHE